jgi:hypothetical protein
MTPIAMDCNEGTAGRELKTSCPQYQTLYDITGLNANKWYKISIAAINSCGTGEFSVHRGANTMNCPQQVTGVNTVIDEENVNVVWDSQIEVSSYEILFRKADGSWWPISECDGNPLQLNGDLKPYCPVLNSVVKAETELDDQAFIVVKIRAKNINCTGPWSEENEGNDQAKIAACPEVMAAVKVDDQLEDIRKTSILLNWTPLTQEQAGGAGIDVTYYEIHAEQFDAAGNSITTETTKIAGNRSSWKHEGLNNAENWRYKIRAENAICGSGATEWSPVASFVTGQPPEKPDVPEVCIENDPAKPDFYDSNLPDCIAPVTRRLRGANGASDIHDVAPKIVIKWPAGSAEDNVTKYEVKILNGEGKFVVHPQCIADQLATPGCALSMSSFWSGEFQMDQGTYITASIEAHNKKGWSVASRWNI